jgi:hypothetical protein
MHTPKSASSANSSVGYCVLDAGMIPTSGGCNRLLQAAAAEMCGVLHIGTKLHDEKQYSVISSLFRAVIFKYFGGYPGICISFTSC